MTDPLDPEKDYDFKPLLIKLSVEEVLFAANYAMNRISLMELGSLGHFLGGHFDLKLTKKEPDHD